MKPSLETFDLGTSGLHPPLSLLVTLSLADRRGLAMCVGFQSGDRLGQVEDPFGARGAGVCRPRCLTPRTVRQLDFDVLRAECAAGSWAFRLCFVLATWATVGVRSSVRCPSVLGFRGAAGPRPERIVPRTGRGTVGLQTLDRLTGPNWRAGREARFGPGRLAGGVERPTRRCLRTTGGFERESQIVSRWGCPIEDVGFAEQLLHSPTHDVVFSFLAFGVESSERVELSLEFFDLASLTFAALVERFGQAFPETIPQAFPFSFVIGPAKLLCQLDRGTFGLGGNDPSRPARSERIVDRLCDVPRVGLARSRVGFGDGSEHHWAIVGCPTLFDGRTGPPKPIRRVANRRLAWWVSRGVGTGPLVRLGLLRHDGLRATGPDDPGEGDGEQGDREHGGGGDRDERGEP